MGRGHLSRAVNQTAFDLQNAMRKGLQDRFVIRAGKARYLASLVEIRHKSNKGDIPIWAEVGIQTKSLLAKFEAGGVKSALDPSEPIAIPSTNIRPSFSALAPLALYPKNLGLVPRHGVVGMVPAKKHITARGVVQLKGKSRTFVLDPSTMFGVKTWGVYQRIGPRRSDVRLIWTFKPKIPIPALLKFYETARLIVPESFAENWGKFWTMALATAKPK